MFNKNIKNTISKVISPVVYCIMDNYACDDYLCCKQAKLHVANKGFENKTFNDILGIGIPELLMNIISCNRFVNNIKSTVIL